VQLFFSKSHELKGKKILITAGPTYESLDPVRFIGNYSTGKMGYALADACVQRGGEVTLISGPVHESIPDGLANIVSVQSAEEMFDAVKLYAADADIIIMAAAVADYTPVSVSAIKIKKNSSDDLVLELKKTVDILQYLGENKQTHQILIGFALETQEGKAYAVKKLKDKNADAIVLNIQHKGQTGFGADTNQITIFEKNGKEYAFQLKRKREVAEDIVNAIKNMLHA
jgi:phosphopantothenoylcysteine decarboxylase/phosphopantothenate--cysteine ligase